jgi:hypothetical protein
MGLQSFFQKMVQMIKLNSRKICVKDYKKCGYKEYQYITTCDLIDSFFNFIERLFAH